MKLTKLLSFLFLIFSSFFFQLQYWQQKVLPGMWGRKNVGIATWSSSMIGSQADIPIN